MWCSHCRQDVPGAAAGKGRITCTRCGQSSTAASHSKHRWSASLNAVADHGIDLAESSPQPPRTDALDDWSLDDDLHQIRRLVSQHKHGAGNVPTHPNFLPLPVAQQAFAALATPAAAGNHDSKQRQRRGSWLGWCLLSLGLMAFACGAVLLGWSVVQGRNDLWTLGMPITLGGQFGLLLGLVLQFDYLWQHNRQTADKLDQVDERLHDLNHTASLLGTTHSSAAQAFYGHLAEGANPQLLLADLKGQLDLLAVKMSRR